MYKMILVDDETLSLKIFSKIIEQNCEGFELVAVFDNAGDAIGYISENHIDVIISDIYMPGIDGLEFLEYIEQNYSDIIFIILTGFKNFEYLKFAISHNAYEYLTKPLDKDELDAVLKKVKTKLDKIADNAEISYSESKFYQSFFDYISGISDPDNAFSDFFQKIDPKSDGKQMPIALVHTSINNIDEVISQFRYGPTRLHTALVQMLRLSNIPVISLNYSISSMNLVLFLNDKKTGDCEEYVNSVLEEFKINCRQLLSIDISASAADIFPSIDDAKDKIAKILNFTAKTPKLTVKNKHINNAIKFIEENYARDISLSDVSSYLHLSSVHLSKLFKANVGCSFINFITNYRLEKAQDMLLNTFMTVAQISESTGFSNVNNFHRTFKKATGMSPQQYRTTQIGKKSVED